MKRCAVVLMVIALTLSVFPISGRQALAASQYGEDTNPVAIGAGAWRFSIDLGVKPTGALGFTGASINFGSQTTAGIQLDYDYNGPGIDMTDTRTFFQIDPTFYVVNQGFV